MDKEKPLLNSDMDFWSNEKSSNSTNILKEDKFEATRSSFPSHRPWIRLVARIIDNYTFAFILAIFWGVFSPSSLPKSDFLFGMLALFLWIFGEAIFLSICGATFGKWLLKIKVMNKKGNKLGFALALRRSFLVWLKGLAMGLPIVYLFPFISAHSDLTKKGITTWDKSCGLVVMHQKIGIIRSTIAALLIILFIISMIIAQMK